MLRQNFIERRTMTMTLWSLSNYITVIMLKNVQKISQLLEFLIELCLDKICS